MSLIDSDPKYCEALISRLDSNKYGKKCTYRAKINKDGIHLCNKHINYTQTDYQYIVEKLKLSEDRNLKLKNLDGEIWSKPHSIYNNYIASNYARVKNIKIDRIILGNLNLSGYTQLQFSYNPDKKSSLLHLFVWECFNGIFDCKQYQIDHIDSDKKKITFNYLDNLQKLTLKEHAQKTHGGKSTKGGPLQKAVWKIKKIDEVIIEKIQYSAIYSLKDFGFDPSKIRACCIGIKKRYRGFYWEYVELLDLKDEIWASLYDPKYMQASVSNLGRIKHMGAVSYGSVHADKYFRKKIATIRYKVHYLICLAFHGNPPDITYTVDHIDRNPENNKAENLRWASRIQQANNRKTVKSVAAYNIVTDQLYKKWDCVLDAANELVCSISSIREACNNSKKKAVGLKWRYVQ